MPPAGSAARADDMTAASATPAKAIRTAGEIIDLDRATKVAATRRSALKNLRISLANYG
jgi:hypothetical protein